ncbi:MAG: winged helix-turn-helix domain-containing protein [Acidobacteriota bacterium]
MTALPLNQLDEAVEALAHLDAGPVEDVGEKLEAARLKFREWLGDEYDIAALDMMLCTLAAERLPGDPLWLLLISGSGNAKTETVQAAQGSGAIVISTIQSEGALLSGTSTKDRTKGATGGLLRTIGERGVLIIKDFTSIISAHRDSRAMLLAAFREMYDGRWVRNVGSDGGRTLEWAGRIAVIGAVTTVWDRAHDVVAAMGDRFVLIRMDSNQGRAAAGLRAMGNVGKEVQMREELAHAVADVIGHVDTAADFRLTGDEEQTLLEAANLVTLARTGVDYDYRGDVIDAHAPEMPTRFLKQLTQVLRGGLSLGMGREEVLTLAVRCARDSIPPLRLAILLDVAKHPWSAVHEVRRRIDKPRATVDRQLQSLHMLGLLTLDEEEHAARGGGTLWHYSIAPGVRPEVLYQQARPSVPEMSSYGDKGIEDRECPDTDISGTLTKIPAKGPTTALPTRRHERAFL